MKKQTASAKKGKYRKKKGEQSKANNMNVIFCDPGLCEDMDREKEEANKKPVDLHITKIW